MNYKQSDAVYLSKVATYINEKIDSSLLNKNNYVSTENMLPNKGGLVRAESIPNGKVNRFLKNDILISNIRPYFKKIWYANKNGGCSADVLTVRSNGEIYSRYLYYVLMDDFFFEYSMKGSKGTKMPRGDKGHIMNYPVRLPSFKTQEVIANILSSLDDKIELNNKINKNLEELTQTLYKRWFVDFEFPNENGDPYKYSSGEMVESEVGLIPKGWDVLTLEDLSENEKNAIVDGPFGTQMKIAEYVDSGIPIVEMYQLNGYENVEGYKNFITLQKFEVVKRSTVKQGDVIISKTGTLGLLGTLNRYHEKGILVSRLAKITPNKELIKPNTLLLLMHFLSNSNHWYQIASGSTMPLLNIGNIKRTKVAFPKKQDISFKFDSIISEMIEMININLHANFKLSKMRDELLPKLMNGEIEVSIKE